LYHIIGQQKFVSRQRGTLVEWLRYSPLVLNVLGLKQSLRTGLFNNHSVHLAVNRYLTHFRAGKVKGVRKRSDAPPQLYHCQCTLAL